VIWAETTLPGWRGWPYRGDVLRAVARRARAPALLGVMIHEREPRRRDTNSALLIDERGRILGRYDKVHPVPGSEYLPLRDWLPDDFVAWAEETVKSYAGFRPVQVPGTSLDPLVVPGEGGDTAVGALICYEVIYPELSRELARRGAHVLVNLTNYGWFGESAQLDQALAITAFRAVETGRPLVVCANTGISATVNASGRVTRTLSREGRVKAVEGWLLAELDVPRDPAAAATVYLVVGDVFVYALAIATALLLILSLLGRIGILARPPGRRDCGQDGPGLSS
jgi:apolipoprotein N-acyltransferase